LEFCLPKKWLSSAVKKKINFFENFKKKVKKHFFFNFVSQKVTKFYSKKLRFFAKKIKKKYNFLSKIFHTNFFVTRESLYSGYWGIGKNTESSAPPPKNEYQQKKEVIYILNWLLLFGNAVRHITIFFFEIPLMISFFRGKWPYRQ
jgi:hypothetical protein